VYVQPFRGRGERTRVSVDGGGPPRWRADGKELFYLAADGSLMAVEVRLRATGLDVGLPATLAPAKDLQALIQGPDYSDYAVTSDGRRFLVRRLANPNERQRLHVLLDWPSLLQ
jgi:hypothetical protein